MDKRQKKAWLILMTYLMVVLFPNDSINSFYDLGFPTSKNFHTHGDCMDNHHDFTFHIGIFHYLGHIYEGIITSDFDTDDHFTIAAKVKTDKKLMSIDIDDFSSQWTIAMSNNCINVLANPPPVDWSIPTNLDCPHLPLRAPPTVA